jgi:hypothetical protein
VDRDAAIALLDRLHEAQNEFYAGGSGAALQRLLASSITWTVPGDNSIAGTYRGLGEVFDTDGSATIRDVDHRWSTVGLYDVVDQRITACWLLPLDQRAFDAIWSA